MAGSWGRAVRQLLVRHVRNGRVPHPSLPAEVRWFSCFVAGRRPLDLAGGYQLPALAEGVKVGSRCAGLRGRPVKHARVWLRSDWPADVLYSLC